MSKLLSFFQALETELLDWLSLLINTDSPSNHKLELDQLIHWFSTQFSSDGAQIRMVDQPDCANHLLARWHASEPLEQQVLILGHVDTVWPLGESERRPARLEEGRVFGPGAFDMRGGLTLVLGLSRFLAQHRSQLKSQVTVLLTSDEEVGSPSSRAVIEEEARQSRLVLVVEPCLPGGALKTSRKGVGNFTIKVRGIAAHAGVDYSKGVSAILELSHQIQQLYTLNDLAKGTTINVGQIRGGTRSNVIAEQAEMEVDIRVTSAAEGKRLTEKVKHLTPVQPGAQLEISGGMNRPPFERTESIIQIFKRAQRLAMELDISLEEGSTGGGSDGCFTAALGVPTLDGLGPDGAGPHALHEHVVAKSLVPRAALLAQLALHL